MCRLSTNSFQKFRKIRKFFLSWRDTCYISTEALRLLKNLIKNAAAYNGAKEFIMNELSLFNSLFDNAFDCGMPDLTWKTARLPKVDVKENKDSYSLQMDLPGATEKDVDIEIDHGVMTISSVKTAEKEEKNEKKEEGKWLIRERVQSQFARRFTLPDDVDETKVTASFKNGVLNVTMARKALPEPKKIAIEVA